MHSDTEREREREREREGGREGEREREDSPILLGLKALPRQL